MKGRGLQHVEEQNARHWARREMSVDWPRAPESVKYTSPSDQPLIRSWVYSNKATVHVGTLPRVTLGMRLNKS